VNVVRFVNVFSAGLVAGAMMMELGILIPTVRALPHAALLALHRGIAPRATKLISPFGALATIAGIVVVLQHDFDDSATLLTIAGLAVWIAAVLTTFLFYLPAVQAILGWGEDAPPDRDAIIARWATTHTTRAVLFGTGFGLFVAAALAA
jgi:hypothetical protein